MSIQEDVQKLYQTELKHIWSYIYSKGTDNELVLNPKYICFEIGNYLLRLHDMDGKIEILVDKEQSPISNIELTYKIDAAGFILDNFEAGYLIEKIGAVNLMVDKDTMVCDAIQIDVCAQNHMRRNIFICAGKQGLRIGGISEKRSWIQNSYSLANRQEK